MKPFSFTRFKEFMSIKRKLVKYIYILTYPKIEEKMQSLNWFLGCSMRGKKEIRQAACKDIDLYSTLEAQIYIYNMVIANTSELGEKQVLNSLYQRSRWIFRDEQKIQCDGFEPLQGLEGSRGVIKWVLLFKVLLLHLVKIRSSQNKKC